MRRNSQRYRLRAEPAAIGIHTVEMVGTATVLQAAAGPDGKRPPPRFDLVAYTGVPMRPHLEPPLKHPVVIDLDGVILSKQRLPALKDHESKALVGHTEIVSSDGVKLTAQGVCSGAGEAKREVVEASSNGYVWEVSLGADIWDLEFVGAGKSVGVNGRTIGGPVYIARSCRPREVSFLTIGADDGTSASIAASAAKGNAMTFAAWLKANGFQPEKELSDKQKKSLRAAWKAAITVEASGSGDDADGDDADDADDEEDDDKPARGKKAKAGKKKTKVKAGARSRQKAAADDAYDEEEDPDDDADDDDSDSDEGVSGLRAELDSIRREQSIYRLCGEKHAEIARKAIKGKWDDDKVSLAIEAAELRASMPSSVQVRTKKAKDAPADNLVLEAACAISGKLENLEEQYDERVLNAAGDLFRHGISLQELLLQAAHANGYTGYSVRQDVRGVLEHAFRVQASGFSTISLPGIFTAVANKFLLEGFMFVETVWRAISDIGSVNDFKTITSYRMTGSGEFEEVGPMGEIKHGTLGEESFTNRAKSYAKMYGISFQDIKNDDLGALTAIPRKLGRGAGLKINTVFWTVFLNNAAFFVDPSQNYLKGATTNLGPVGLGLALPKFRQKIDPDGAPLSVEPKILLVPPELEVTAMELMQSTNFNTGGAATGAQIAQRNIWANKFTTLVSVYLSNSAFTGFSTTGYYLLGDPRDAATMQVVFLDGKEQPTVENAEADFNNLGVQMRGHHHWGVALQDARAALKVKGAA